ncbi:NAD(+) synthase [Alteromonas sp. ASW11-19]|uniref:Glutamine-dependent NAD(+) synthetase n=1 Tax=Alteromonas salexigens TaxID=2982530 RepID=A0ABT2VPZ7_9ALTE|nr:NAD(+) synthase [Alteromonas salexigens]MCU7555393.1 NAD(+) synthase [Alteromonas salexigens]
MNKQQSFNSIYTHGFARVAVCIPQVKVADPAYNSAQIIELAQRAASNQASVCLFPELCISAYSCGDLFHQDALLDGCEAAIKDIKEASKSIRPLLLVGAPLNIEGALYNCALAIHNGRILGIVPKTFLPNYREFYEKRQFTSGRDCLLSEVELLGEQVPFGSDLIYNAVDVKHLRIHSEICEDLWTPIPPSTYAALAGATLLTNLSASNITIGKARYRRDLCARQSGACIAAYLYAAAGPGESTTDLAWDGHGLIFENDKLLKEAGRFTPEADLLLADVDLERLSQDRMRLTSFQDSVSVHKEQVAKVRRIDFTLNPVEAGLPLLRDIDRFPFVPADSGDLDTRCYETFNIQIHGLKKRLKASGFTKLVIGVSGGLDSTHALIVAAKTMDRMDLPRSNILAYTMPAYATSSKTKSNAHILMESLGVTAKEIDIQPSCDQMLRDIEHPYARGEEVYDVNFENVQAGERTSHLFRLAGQNHALVLGTGDLSEIGLGWMTYGVGDHMSHYNVNASVPKTLIQHLIRWIADQQEFDADTRKVLTDIVDTEISPELVPGKEDGEQPAQKTEDKIGPYELQDFNLYWSTRYGVRPSKVAFLAYHAWHDKEQGSWPSTLPEASRNEYALKDIKHWLEVYCYRFFKISQFKRSALPDGPKVGSGGSLSPRGDWRAPSDAEAEVWLEEIKNIPDSL